MRKIFLFWAPLAVYASLVVYMSLAPSPIEGPEVHGIDKFYHFMMYAVMGLLLARAVAAGAGPDAKAHRVILITALAGFLFGVLMEIGQMFVPERAPEALDALANGAGALAGSIVYGRLILKKAG
jgi:VanZ family protein